jgi:hypothetical protein
MLRHAQISIAAIGCDFSLRLLAINVRSKAAERRYSILWMRVDGG